jgi:hypothetical protein
MSRNLESSLGKEGLDKGGQGPTSGCCAIEEEEEDCFLEVECHLADLQVPEVGRVSPVEKYCVLCVCPIVVNENGDVSA